MTFKAPLSLAEVDRQVPVETYNVETDEDIVEDLERTVYVRCATLLYVETDAKTEVVTIDPRGLEAALAADREL